MQLTQPISEVTQMLELPVKDFKISVIYILMDLMENVGNLHKSVRQGNIKKEMETIKRTQIIML